jgi:uncharacterized protein
LTPKVSPEPPIWRAFRFDTGDFLLHVPSSHVLEVPKLLALAVRGEPLPPAEAADAASQLAALAAELPLPPPRRPVTVDNQAVSLNMAQGCNLRCTYCFAGEGDYGNKSMMTPATAIKTVEFFARGADGAFRERFHVIFFGGEPMLNFSAIQAVVEWCEAQPCRFSFAMTTNGTLLTAEKVEWLKSKRFALNLSYDGKGLQARQRLTKDKTHNSESLVERKLASFTTQLGELRAFLLRATVTKANLDLLEEAIVSTLTARNFRLMVSHHATALRSLAFGDADIDKLGAVYQRVIDRFLAAGDYERLLRLDNLKGHLQTIHRGKTAQIACGAGVNYLTVSTAGRFYLCHRFNEDESECYGDVETGLDRGKLAAVAAFRDAKADPCRSCWMREWCAGGCFHEHKAARGDKFEIDPMYCKLQGIEIEQAMRVYTHLLQHAPHLLT